MTKSVMKQIFIVNANRIEAGIKKQGADILAECTDFALLIDGKKSDAMRKAILEDGRFAFLYDTKSDKGKLVMSDKMRQVKSAMADIFTHAEQFTLWYSSDEKTGVTSLRGIRDAIKPKAEKKKSDSPSQKSDAGADDAGDEAIADEKTPRTKSEIFANFLQIWKAETGGDALDFLQYCESAESMKIADDFTDAKTG